MIPDSILRRLVHQGCSPRTSGNDEKIRKILAELGIPLECELAELYLQYDPGVFLSDSSYEQLVDVLVKFADGFEPTPFDALETPVGMATNFIREVWGLPDNLICLTTCEGEGGYLYDSVSEAIYDFGLDERDDFIAGKLAPLWKSFYEFLDWYLSDRRSWIK